MPDIQKDLHAIVLPHLDISAGPFPRDDIRVGAVKANDEMGVRARALKTEPLHALKVSHLRQR
jgi:hypothetical protein